MHAMKVQETSEGEFLPRDYRSISMTTRRVGREDYLLKIWGQRFLTFLSFGQITPVHFLQKIDKGASRWGKLSFAKPYKVKKSGDGQSSDFDNRHFAVGKLLSD